MRAAFPSRFGVETVFPFKNPEEYVRGFMRAVVAASVLRSRRVAAKSPATTAMLDELERVSLRDGQQFGVIWLLDDVNFEAVADARVGDIVLSPPDEGAPELFVSNLLPGAQWAHESARYPAPFAKRQGLIYSTGTGPGHHWDVTTPINNAMDRFLRALRLATASTTPVRMVWMGETSMIQVGTPEAAPQMSDFGDSHWRRLAKITPENLTGLRRLSAMIDKLELGPTKRRATRMCFRLWWWPCAD
jgi:hypothetical protein